MSLLLWMMTHATILRARLAAALQSTSSSRALCHSRWARRNVCISSTTTSSQASSFVGECRLKHMYNPQYVQKVHHHYYYYSTRSSITMMPEGPEVKTLVEQLQPAIGCRLVDWKFVSGRYAKTLQDKPRGWNDFRATMTPYDDKNTDNTDTGIDRILDWKCKGKFIYLLLDSGSSSKEESTSRQQHEDEEDYQRSIWITLGMTGKFVSQKAQEAMPAAQQSHTRWYLELLDDSNNNDDPKLFRIYYHDRRNFGTVIFSNSRRALVEKLASLGPDILDTRFTRQDFVNILSEESPERNISKLLMNQQKISGIGNYILAEGLYRASVDPYATIEHVSLEEQLELFDQIRAVAQESYEAQQQPSNNDGDNRSSGEYEMQCYGRQVAENGEPVLRDVNGPHGRTIHFVKSQLKPHGSLNQHPYYVKLLQGDASRLENPSLSSGSPPAPMRYNSKGGPVPRPRPSVAPGVQGTPYPPETGPKKQQRRVNLSKGLVEESWKEALQPFMESDTFSTLEHFIQQELESGHTIYPPSNSEIFTALNVCPLEDVKVVILGQDPYISPGQAHGLAFSVKSGVKPPPSLRNIFQELMEEGLIMEDSIPHGNLEHWAKQGVLLLNTVLTVRAGQSNSHANQGWEDFTNAVVTQLVQRTNKRLVFLLWGNPAAQKASSCDIPADRHIVIRTSHPSPLSASRTKSPFLGSGCFRKANEALQEMGEHPIDWNVAE